jgi:hypothetical protein
LWTCSDESGWHYINNGVWWVSTGRQGILDYIDNGGNAWLYSEVLGAPATWLTGGAYQVTTGTDQNGDFMIDLILSDGSAWEYRASAASWTNLWSSAWGDQVVALGKGRQGLVDVTFLSGNALEHDATGFTNYLGSNVLVAG